MPQNKLLNGISTDPYRYHHWCYRFKSLLWIATFFMIIILGLAFDTPKSSTLFHTSHEFRFPHSKSSKNYKVGFNNQNSQFFITGEGLPSPKDSRLYMWKPPNEGGRKGYYNFNERGDSDPDKLNRYRRGNKWNRKCGIFLFCVGTSVRKLVEYSTPCATICGKKTKNYL